MCRGACPRARLRACACACACAAVGTRCPSRARPLHISLESGRGPPHWSPLPKRRYAKTRQGPPPVVLNPWTFERGKKEDEVVRGVEDWRAIRLPVISSGGEEMDADCATQRQRHKQKSNAICNKRIEKENEKTTKRRAWLWNLLFLSQPRGPLWLHVATVAHWAGWGRAHCCVDAARAPLRPPVCVPTTDGSGDGCAIGLLYLDHATSCHCIAGPHGCFTREYRGNICLLWVFYALPLSRWRGYAYSTEH